MTKSLADAGVTPPDFRMPPQLRLGRVRLQVADIERSLGFYRDLLGFAVLDAGDDSVALGASADGASAPAAAGPRPLIELVERPGARPVPRHGRLGLYHVAVLLPDRAALGSLLADLIARGASLGSADHEVSEALYLSDPDGLGVEIYADRPRENWRRQGREIAMTTEPLDARALIAASSGRPWRGLPAGASIGHIHFSVDDLAVAERWFHAGLGLDKVVWSYPGALFFSAGGYHHHVGANTWARFGERARDDDARLLEWRIVVRDDEAADEALASIAKADASRRVEHAERSAEDPWGATLRIETDG